MRTKLITILFFLSGVCALIYEMIWMKQLSLILGITTYAIGLLLITFLGGLCIGSLIISRIKLNIRIAYPAIEIIVGIYAFFVPLSLKLIWTLSPLWQYPIAILILFIPTFLLGGTFPLITQYVTSRYPNKNKTISILYFVNTLGGVIGVALSTYYLIPKFGFLQTNTLTAGLNIIISILFFLVAKRTISKQARFHLEFNHTALILFLTGFSSLSLEIVWTRLFTHTQFFGLSTYSFANVLILYLLGIAIGSLLLTFINLKLDTLLIIASMSSFVTIPLYFDIQAFSSYIPYIKYFLIAIPTASFGMIFPLLAASYTKKNIAKDVGSAYFLNTLGGILGILITSFLLIQYIGTFYTIAIFSGLLLLLSRRNLFTYGIIIAMLIFAGMYAQERVKNQLFFDEGISITTTVHGDSTGYSIQLNGQNLGGTSSIDNATNTYLVLLPLLYNPQAITSLQVGLGVGTTAGTMAQFKSIQHIDIVELAENVIEGSKLIKDYNYQVHDNKKVNIFVGDGRRYILTTQQHYDIILTEPMHLNLAGSGNLFTLEYFTEIRKHLLPRGVAVQWVPLYDAEPEHVQSILNTFASVFPVVDTWIVNNELILVGGEELDFSSETLKEYLDQYSSIFDVILIESTENFLVHYIMNASETKEFSKHSILNTDNNLYIEYNTPLITGYTPEKNKQKLYESISPKHLEQYGLNNSFVEAEWTRIFGQKLSCLVKE